MASAPTFASNPIARAERAYQERSAPRRTRFQRFTRLIIIVAFTLAFILAGGELTGALLYRDPEPINRAIGVAGFIPLGVVVFFHFALILRTLSLSANSIAREKQANNWDILVLTGINARQIIRGKWVATMARMWRTYLVLAVLRVLMVIWFAAMNSRQSSFGYAAYLQMFGQGPFEIIVPTPGQFLLAALVIFVLTMVNLPLTAACGVSAISTRGRNSALALGRAISMRLLVLLGFCVLVLGILSLIWSRAYLSGYSNLSGWIDLSRFIQSVAFTMVDNGVTVASQFVYYRISTQYIDPVSALMLPIAIASLGLYGLFTWGLLRFAEWQAARQNALPHPRPIKSTATSAS